MRACWECGSSAWTSGEWLDRHEDDAGHVFHPDCCVACEEARREQSRLQGNLGRPVSLVEVSGSCVNPTQEQIAEGQTR